MVNKKIQKQINYFAKFGVGACALFFLAILLASIARAEGASFSFSNPGGSYNIGDNFSVIVYVNSASQSINAVSGAISFPSDKLAVVSISRAKSIVDLWVQDPIYSNTAGVINFQGIIFNPGFTGDDGNILAINFQVKAPGLALVSFTTGSILANNGQGTNILAADGLPSSQYAINVPQAAGESVGVLTPSYVSGPLAPVVSSKTHPDQNKWYSSDNVQLAWKVPDDIDAVRLLLSDKIYSIPDVTYKPPINQKEIDNLTDGTWYFSARFHDVSGWGAIAYFKINIDTTPPELFNINFASSTNPANPSPIIILNAADKTSGIAYYKIKIDDQNPITVLVSQLNDYQYALPEQQSGQHTIAVLAYDQAGNYRLASSTFDVNFIFPPTITDYNRYLIKGESLLIMGKTYPNAAVTIWLESDNKLTRSFSGVSEANGNFMIVATDLDIGRYKMWAKATDNRGIMSPSTQTYDVLVSQEFLRIGNYTLNIYWTILLFIILILLIQLLLIFIRDKFLLKEIYSKHNIQGKLRRDIQKLISFIKKSKMPEEFTEEEELLSEIKNDLKREEEKDKNPKKP